MMSSYWIRRVLVSCLSVLCLAGCAFAEGALSAYLDRSYYTTEQKAVVVCVLELPVEQIAAENTLVSVTDAAGTVLAQAQATSTETRIPLNIAGLPIGEHSLAVEVQQQSGAAAFAQELVLDKKPPKPGCEIKVDKINMVILRNGEPFFPHGLLIGGNDGDHKAAAAMGFNTVHTWLRGRKPEQATEYVKSAAKYGLLSIINTDGFCRGAKLDTLKELVSAEELEKAQKTVAYAGRSPKKFTYGLARSSVPALKKLPDEAKARLVEEYFQKNEANYTAALNLAKESPNVLGYCLYDEPATFLSVLLGRMFYKRTNEVDGYRPRFVIGYFPQNSDHNDWMDVLGTDPYWVPGGSGVRGTVNYVSKITCLSKQEADKRRQVTWSMPMAEYWSGIRKRGIMPKEQFCQTYLAIIHGAKAIVYFRWPFKVQKSMDMHTALSKQIKVLGPVAVTPDIPQTITYNPGEFDPGHDKFPDVQVSLRRNPKGGYVLLAANSRYYPVDVTYRISLLRDGTTVKQMFNGTGHSVKDSCFTDRVDFMGTRAYAFDSEVPLTGRVEISVEMKSYPDQVDPVYGAPGLPDTGRPGKRNLMRNPGFEEAGLLGWPDYYLFSVAGPRAGRPGSEYGYGLDTENPYEGKASLWVHAKAGSVPNSTLFYGACSPKVTEETPFVLSAYMRANRNGVKVRFKGFGWRVPKPTFGYKEFTLATEWERY